eukprot:8028515-Karenia_brevis.AAC.1
MPARSHYQAKTPGKVQDGIGKWSHILAQKQRALLMHYHRGHQKGFAKLVARLHCREWLVHMRVMSGGNTMGGSFGRRNCR